MNHAAITEFCGHVVDGQADEVEKRILKCLTGPVDHVPTNNQFCPPPMTIGPWDSKKNAIKGPRDPTVPPFCKPHKCTRWGQPKKSKNIFKSKSKSKKKKLECVTKDEVKCSFVCSGNKATNNNAGAAECDVDTCDRPSDPFGRCTIDYTADTVQFPDKKKKELLWHGQHPPENKQREFCAAYNHDNIQWVPGTGSRSPKANVGMKTGAMIMCRSEVSNSYAQAKLLCVKGNGGDTANEEYFDELQEENVSYLYPVDSTNSLLIVSLLSICLCCLLSILCGGSGLVLGAFGGYLYRNKQKQIETNQYQNGHDVQII